MSTPSPATSKTKTGGCGATVFGVGWILFSSIFVAAGLWMAWGAIRAMGWEEVPCTITKFEIVRAEDKDDGFRADLAYEYRYAGRSHTGTRLWQSGKNERDDYEDLVELREPLLIGPEGQRPSAAGAMATCKVNPSNPAESCLFKTKGGEVIGGVIFAIFGSFFVLIGVFIVLGDRVPAVRSRPIKNGLPGTIFGIAFFGIFGLAGFGMLFGLIVPKAIEWFRMRSWTETTAEIIDSRVARHSDSDGTTYSVDLFYRYEFAGREYRSNRYSLIGGSSSGHKGKQEVVADHPSGSTLQVFVDPAKPWRAVVKRSAGWGALFALFPLPFIAVGVGGIWAGLRKGKAAASPARSKTSAVADPPIVPAAGGPKGWGSTALVSGDWQPTRLKPGCSVAGLIGMALFWNGLVSVFVWQDIKLYLQGTWVIGIVLSLFLVPFVGIGLMIIGGVVQHFILLFGPRFEVQLDQAELRPGESTRLRWRRSGGRGTVKSFDLLLLGQEEVQSDGESGKQARPGRSVFHEEMLFTTRDSLASARGQVELKIPEEAVPSFAAGKHVIRWMLCLRAKVDGMPSIRDDRDLLVRPPQPPSA